MIRPDNKFLLTTKKLNKNNSEKITLQRNTKNLQFASPF
ncbi:hypothetical protein [Pseudomonas phage vB_Pa-PAC2]